MFEIIPPFNMGQKYCLTFFIGTITRYGIVHWNHWVELAPFSLDFVGNDSKRAAGCEDNILSLVHTNRRIHWFVQNVCRVHHEHNVDNLKFGKYHSESFLRDQIVVTIRGDRRHRGLFVEWATKMRKIFFTAKMNEEWCLVFFFTKKQFVFYVIYIILTADCASDVCRFLKVSGTHTFKVYKINLYVSYVVTKTTDIIVIEFVSARFHWKL